MKVSPVIFFWAIVSLALASPPIRFNRNSITNRLATTERANAEPRAAVEYRLPTTIRPLDYYVFLVPFISVGNFTTDGSISIHLFVEEATPNITFHKSNDLVIESLSVRYAEQEDLPGPEIPIISEYYEPVGEQYTVTVNETLRALDHYYLVIKFVSQINNGLGGFYRSSYVDYVTGETIWLACTQFEPTDARKAFPCFDEPSFKARWHLSIAHSPDTDAIANMPLVATTPYDAIDGWSVNVFEASVAMSSYLVAFVVSNFPYVRSPVSETVPFRTFTRPDFINYTAFSAEIGPQVLTYFSDYFVPYSLPKSDQIALPDFSAGAMENWGLVTYRETLLVWSPEVSDTAAQFSIANVIAHELAHQWFGDLVTMQWWNDIWLNEGFATYFSYAGLDGIKPDWESLDQQFLVDEQQAALEVDSLSVSRSVEHDVSSPSEISAMFDTITYSKGGSLLRMIAGFLSVDTFRAGLVDYLETYSYSNAVQDYLFQKLQDASVNNPDVNLGGATVKQIMDTWTLKPGFPLVTAIRTYEQNGPGEVTLTQERFYQNPTITPDPADRWWVPVFLQIQGSTDGSSYASEWFNPEQDSLVITENIPGSDQWVLINQKQTGFYRVNYDDTNWLLLTSQLRSDSSVIDSQTRAQLIDDSFVISATGVLPYNVPLSLSLYLTSERDYVAWQTAFGRLIYLYDMFSETQNLRSFQNYLTTILTPAANDYGVNANADDTLIIKLTRTAILDWSCGLDFEECVATTRTLFNTWKNETNPDSVNPVAPDLRPATYCTSIANGDNTDFDFLYARYSSLLLPSEKDLILYGLSCSRDPAELQSLLLQCLNAGTTDIDVSDRSYCFRLVASSIDGTSVAFEFIQQNFDQIVQESVSLIGTVIRAIAEKYNTVEQLQQVQQFIDANSIALSSISSTLNAAIEEINVNIWWADNYMADVVQWLAQNNF